MHQQSRLLTFFVVAATAFSLVSSLAVSPDANAMTSSGISAKKKVLTSEQRKAKSALEKAVIDLKSKEKNLKAAVKAQAKTGKELAKAQAAVAKSQVSATKITSTKIRAQAKAVAAALKKAKGKNAKAVSLVARRTVLRDISQAKVIRLNAKYAWLIDDISALDCGVGTEVVTASGAIEKVRECGIVYMHEDGDTTHVKTTTNQLIEVRNIGLQTPEMKKGTNPAQCGAKQAYQNFMNLMPEETTIVQLRSLTNSSNGWGGGSRPTRSVYKLNNATGAFDIDVQAEQIKAGWSLWWPLAAEWAHNKEYLDLMNTAKTEGAGLWDPNLCGDAKGAAPLMWFNQNAPSIGSNTEPAFGEYVILYNPTGVAMDLTNWSLRDNSLNFFWNSTNGKWMQKLNKFGSLILQPGKHKIIYLDNPSRYPLSVNEYEYFNWSRNTPGPQLTNGSVKGSYANGEGLYLQDSAGNIRTSMTNPCTSAAMCEIPGWVLDITSDSLPGQIIPIPVALNKVKNLTRDIYNPVITFTLGGSLADTKSAITAKGFIVANGNSYNSPYATGTIVAVTDSGVYNGVNSALGQRRAIADLLGRTPTKIYVHAASGLNTIPSLIGLSEANAKLAIVAAGFTVGAISQTSDAGVNGVTSQVQSGSAAVKSVVSFTVNTPPIEAP